MNISFKEFMSEIGKSYQLVLGYDKGKENMINDIYRANSIIDKNGEAINIDDVFNYNLFLLQDILECRMVFTSIDNPNTQIIIPMCFIETMFNSKYTITSDIIKLFKIREFILEDKVEFFDCFDESFIKLSDIGAEYIYDGKLNNDNYKVVPIRLGKEKILTELLVNVPYQQLKNKMLIKNKKSPIISK